MRQGHIARLIVSFTTPMLLSISGIGDEGVFHTSISPAQWIVALVAVDRK
ncbi:MAG: hypothetical protein ACK5MR_15805 [Cumulibacter sp.]